MSKRTITLTDRPPVTIDDDVWGLIASASDKEYDGQVECQANRTSKWFVGLRQHDDGRTLVYATYSYSSNWQGARNYSAKRGVLLPGTPDSAALVNAIRDVCDDIARAECDGNDADRWPTLAAGCIADLPAEELA